MKSNLEIQKAEPKTFYTLAETPWYFGAYLNQARHNLYLSLNELTVKLAGKPMTSDEQIGACKAITVLNEANPKPIELEKAMEYYERNFPFLYAMHYKFSTQEESNIRKKERNSKNSAPIKNLASDPIKYHQILVLLIELLNGARNHFSHYSDTPFEIKHEAEYLLNDAFDVNVRIVKHRFKLDDKQTFHLRRFEDGKGEDGKAIKKKNFRYAFSKYDVSREISEYGLAFFISLFLSKGQAYLFLKKIQGLKRGDNSEFAATVETFCINTLRLPKERVASDNSAQATFLDMCNELAKCPSELFELLSPTQQQHFIARVSKEKENEDLAIDEADEEIQESRMVRKNSRFTFFALRYFDIMKSLPLMRFGIDLGTFYYSIYPKTIAGHSETRQLTKHLIGYGRLEDFAKERRPKEFAALYKDVSPLDSTQTEPYIREIYPNYQVDNNVIPLFINRTEEPSWPKIDLLPTNAEKSYPNKLQKDLAPKPYACLSANELPAMLFYELLRDGQANNIQQTIIDHVENVKKFFRKIKAGEVQPLMGEPLPKLSSGEKRETSEYDQRFELVKKALRSHNLKPGYLPDRIVDYLMGIVPREWEKQAQGRLIKMKEEAAFRLEKMEQREQAEIKPGKKSFRKIKVGKLADILAEDMMLMQPVLRNPDESAIVNSKANSTAFRLLQGRLAYFGVHKHEMKGIFKACNLIGGSNDHPFLHKVTIEDKVGIIDFYKGYFSEKESYLAGCIKDGKYANYHFLKTRKMDGDITTLVSCYLNEHRSENFIPPLLSRGIFFDKCTDWLNDNGSDIMKQYLVSHENNTNSIHLINHYFAHELKDEGQLFHEWDRAYRLYNRVEKKKEQPQYLTKKKLAETVAASKLKIMAYKAQMDKYKVDAEADKMSLAKKMANCNTKEDVSAFLSKGMREQYPAIKEVNFSKIFRNFRNASIRKIEAAIDESVQQREKTIRDFADYMQNERYLRLVAVEDKLLFMCIGKMLERHVGGIALERQTLAGEAIDKFLLKNIVPVNDTSVKNILDCVPSKGISLSLDYYKPDEKGNLKKDNVAGAIVIFDRHLKIKNAGNFRKLAKDRRLNNLFFYFDTLTGTNVALNRMVLENELNAYEKMRLEVLKQIAEFETKMYKKYAANAQEWFYVSDGVQHHKNYLDKLFELHAEAGQTTDGSILLAIRNGFVHNQFPYIADEAQRQQFMTGYDSWNKLNIEFSPAAMGSTLGYGVIDRIAAYGINGYKKITDML